MQMKLVEVEDAILKSVLKYEMGHHSGWVEYGILWVDFSDPSEHRPQTEDSRIRKRLFDDALVSLVNEGCFESQIGKKLYHLRLHRDQFKLTPKGRKRLEYIRMNWIRRHIKDLGPHLIAGEANIIIAGSSLLIGLFGRSVLDWLQARL